MLSRRALIGLLANGPVVEYVGMMPVNADAELLSLGAKFDDITEELDSAVARGTDISEKVLGDLGLVEARIIGTSASTVEGLRVKARAACWALLGDLQSGDQSTTDKRMALSIVRDLIRLYDPGRERPGALQRLLEEIEREGNASQGVVV